MKKIIMASISLLVAAFSAQANLLTDGSFENTTPAVGAAYGSVIEGGGTWGAPAALTSASDGYWYLQNKNYVKGAQLGWTGQDGTNAFKITNTAASTALVGTFQIVDVTSLGDISGQKLSFSYDMGRSSTTVGGAVNARYQVIGFNDKSTVNMDYFGLNAGFSGTGYDAIAINNGISAESMGLGNLTNSFGAADVTLASDYNYIGVFLAASDTGASNADGGFVAIDSVNLTVIPEPATLGLISLMGGSMLFIRRLMM